MTTKEEVIKELEQLSEEQVQKVLIFIAGLEAGRRINAPQSRSASAAT